MMSMSTFITDINPHFKEVVVKSSVSWKVLKEIQNKYSDSFKKLQYKLVIDYNEDPQYGRCCSFYIQRESISD